MLYDATWLSVHSELKLPEAQACGGSREMMGLMLFCPLFLLAIRLYLATQILLRN